MYGDKAFIARVRPGTDAESKVHPGDQVLAWNTFDVTRDALWKMTYVFNAIAPQDVSRLALRDPAGATREVVVQPFRQQQKRVLDVAGHDGDSDIWQLIREDETADHLVRQRYSESEGAMIWKMPEFDMTDDQVDRMFAIVHKYPALILDLRGNPGGLVVTLERMLANVFDHDVKIADRIGRKELKPQMAKTTGRQRILRPDLCSGRCRFRVRCRAFCPRHSTGEEGRRNRRRQLGQRDGGARLLGIPGDGHADLLLLLGDRRRSDHERRQESGTSWRGAGRDRTPHTA